MEEESKNLHNLYSETAAYVPNSKAQQIKKLHSAQNSAVASQHLLGFITKEPTPKVPTRANLQYKAKKKDGYAKI